MVILKNIVASFAIKGSSLLLALLTMPAYIRFFDNQQVLGLWFTIITTLSWILNFDMGLGNGLRNRLVSALGENSVEKARGYISSTYLVTFGLVVLLGLFLGILVPLVDWNAVFNVSKENISSESLTAAVGFIFAGILAQLLLRTITSILFALQKAALPALLSLATNASLLAFVLLVEPGTSGHNVLMLAQAYALAANLPLVIATILVFATSLRHCLPWPSAFRFVDAVDVFQLGGTFFLLQILFMLLANTNPFLISRLSDPKDVVDFQVYSRPFTALSTLFVLALTPIWSAVTEAVVKSDFGWLDQLFKRLSVLAVMTTLVMFAFVPALQPFVDVWLGANAIHIDPGYALAFAASASVFAWNGVLSSIANGAGILRVQGIMLALGVALKLLIASTMTAATGAWIWVVVSDVAALVPYLVVQSVCLRRFTRNSGRCGKGAGS
ncbi:hypothetical protein [Raineyella antarctica]|uniref:hypothetical protein n=1 Tax=Raineyella antarctica TaxID=1577474 RepID=UPI000B867EBE|nr:hypothetical protein [Raineyella antarctica]